MSDEALKELISRLRMLARNRIAQGRVDITIGKFVIGEDLATGNLSVDVTVPLMRRNSRGRICPSKVGRLCFMVVGRDGSASIKRKYKPLLDELSRDMVLDELADI